MCTDIWLDFAWWTEPVLCHQNINMKSCIKICLKHLILLSSRRQVSWGIQVVLTVLDCPHHLQRQVLSEPPPRVLDLYPIGPIPIIHLDPPHPAKHRQISLVCGPFVHCQHDYPDLFPSPDAPKSINEINENSGMFQRQWNPSRRVFLTRGYQKQIK